MAKLLDHKDQNFVTYVLKLSEPWNRKKYHIPVCNPGGDPYRQKVIHKLRYVNVYSVNRYEGGSEEGGWWYDSLDYIHHSIPCRNYAIADFVFKALRAKYPETKDRFSARGGTDIVVYMSNDKAKVTTERPYYE